MGAFGTGLKLAFTVGTPMLLNILDRGEAQIDIIPGMGPNGETVLADLGGWIDCGPARRSGNGALPPNTPA